MPIVQNPTAGDVHVNRPLTNFAQAYTQSADTFVATRAWPNLPVAHQSDLYYEFDRADFFRDEAVERADGTESAGGGYRVATNPYMTRVFAFHKDVTDRQRANADEQIRLDQGAVNFVTQKLLIRRERMMVSALFSPNIWYNGGTSASAGENVNWALDATSGTTTATNPILAFRNAIRGIHERTGLRPNRVLMGRQAYDTLMDNDEILARITGGATTNTPAMVRRQLLAALFEVDEIIVMDSVVNTAAKDNKTQATPGVEPTNLNSDEDMSFIGGDNVLLYYAPQSVSMEEPTAGIQFSWTGFMGATGTGLRIKRFRVEAVEADRIEGQMAFDYKVTAPVLGHLFVDVSS